MKKLFVLLVSAIMCMQFAACDILLEGNDQIKNEPEKPSHVFSTADGSTLEIALTQGQGENLSPVTDQWSRKLDISDQSVYGDALSRMQSGKLISENGKLNPNKWMESSLNFIYSKPDSTTESTNKTVDATGTYINGSYQANNSYGVRAVGIDTDKGFEVYACIVDLAFQSTEGGTLSLCTGENGSTLKTIINTIKVGSTTDGVAASKTTSPDTTISYVYLGSSNLRLVFFDTETYEILGIATTRTTLSGAFTSSESTESSSSSSSVLSGAFNNSSISLVALDKDGNELEGNLSLGELIAGETRRVSVLIYNDARIGSIAGGNNDKENNDKDKEGNNENDKDYYYGSNDVQETETNEKGEIVYESKYEIVIGAGSSNIEYETGKIQFNTALNMVNGYSFNLIFTDK